MPWTLPLLERHPDPVLRIGRGGLLWSNEAARTVFGAHLTRLLTREEREELLRWAAEPGEARRSMLCRGAKTRLHLARSQPAALDGDALVICTIGQASQEAVANRRYEQAFDTREIGIYEHDHHTDVIFADDRLRRMWDFAPDQELTVMSFVERVHPDDQLALATAVQNAHDPRGDGIFDVTHRLVDPDGSIRWVHMKGRSYFYEDALGERAVRRTVGSMLDVTAQVLRTHEIQRLATALEATPDVVALARPSGSLLYVNAAARALIADSGAPEPLDSTTLLALVAPASRDRFRTVTWAEVEAEGLWTGELDLRRADSDETMPALVTVQHHEDALREGGFVSLVGRDLTDQHELEAQLLHSQKLEAIGRLAGGIAHDFNNMLSVIEGFTYLASEAAADNEAVLECIEPIQHASRSAARLTSELLSFSRKQVLRPQLVSLARVVGGLRTMIERLMGDDIDVRLDLQGSESRALIDPGRIEQVVMNLVVNARDAMPRGGTLLLETSVVHLDADYARGRAEVQPGDYVLLAVSDSGQGMDERTLSRVFEPFFTTKGVGEGTGLGLATVFGTVRQSGGHIWVYSELGRGTTFKVYLPVAEGERKEPAAPEDVPEASLEGLRVLVVDDEPRLRRMILHVLQRHGLVPVEANGPVEALAIARSGRVQLDLLLTDVVMPQMSGKELADALVEAGVPIPVLYMSGYTENTVVHHGVVDEGVHFLSKPFTPQQLIDAIAALVVTIVPDDLEEGEYRR